MKVSILIVEDESIVRGFTARFLERELRECVCFGVATAEEALVLLRLYTPSLVVMDVNLPGMNGIEATRRISMERPGVPVVMYSADEDAATLRAATEAGARGFVSKGEHKQLAHAASRFCVARPEGDKHE